MDQEIYWSEDIEELRLRIEYVSNDVRASVSKIDQMLKTISGVQGINTLRENFNEDYTLISKFCSQLDGLREGPLRLFAEITRPDIPI